MQLHTVVSNAYVYIKPRSKQFNKYYTILEHMYSKIYRLRYVAHLVDLDLQRVMKEYMKTNWCYPRIVTIGIMSVRGGW